LGALTPWRSSRPGQFQQQVIHRGERADRLGPERGLATLPALDLPVQRAAREVGPRHEVNVGQELGRHDQRGSILVTGSGLSVRQAAAGVPQRAVHDDQQALDAITRHVEGTRRVAQQ
jgi:hypothetical protein